MDKKDWNEFIESFPTYSQAMDKGILTNGSQKTNGYKFENLVGKINRVFYICILSEDEDWAKGVISKLLDTSYADHIEQSTETMIRYKNGNIISWHKIADNLRGNRFSGAIIDSRYTKESWHKWIDLTTHILQYAGKEFLIVL